MNEIHVVPDDLAGLLVREAERERGVLDSRYEDAFLLDFLEGIAGDGERGECGNCQKQQSGTKLPDHRSLLSGNKSTLYHHTRMGSAK
jgi:hypothetical protein